ncbi:MAG: exodeoxyribonuclease III [Pseudomonadota bacterium]|nr:exodeoxyribonuclease III [Pseudomonadota bacterium]
MVVSPKKSKHFSIVSWNINSIKVRLERVLDFCQRLNPDVLCLQELKCVEASFPYAAFAELGYRHAVVSGQKQYNGVAILSPHALQATRVGLLPRDPAARWVEASIGALRVICLYAPNGKEVGSDKYSYKLDWYAAAAANLRENYSATAKTAIVGDFNVAPADIDVHNPKERAGKLLCSVPERQALATICALGYHDHLRLKYPDETIYSWWDYRQFSFQRGKGFRIDFALVSDGLLPHCLDTTIVRDERKQERPSDHAPVVLSCAREACLT